jgi:hypothetical protein
MTVGGCLSILEVGNLVTKQISVSDISGSRLAWNFTARTRECASKPAVSRTPDALAIHLFRSDSILSLEPVGSYSKSDAYFVRATPPRQSVID